MTWWCFAVVTVAGYIGFVIGVDLCLCQGQREVSTRERGGLRGVVVGVVEWPTERR